MKVVVGLGKTGLSCVRHLVRAGEQVVVVDTRLDPPGLAELAGEFPQVECRAGELPSSLLLAASQIVISPGIALETPVIAAAIANGVEVVGDIELFCRQATKPIVAITGSNAKSTVTTLVGEMAKHAGLRTVVAGNIGIPVLDTLADDASTDLYVLELSSFQLETTRSLRACAATILNVSPDHLDRYPGMKEYTEAKHRIYAQSATQVFNADDEATLPAGDVAGMRTGFGISGDSGAEYFLRDVDGATWLARGDQNLLSVSELKIKGRHNHLNALASIALGAAAGLPMPSMLSALREFQGLPHRCQWVRQCNGVAWYNDSKGTNVGATVAAIEGLGADLAGRIVLIAGGDGKGADFLELIEPGERFLSAAVLIGRDADRLAHVLAPVCRIERAVSLQDAVHKAAVLASPGDAVLLSPACASFDMFKGYDDRGRQFVAAVEALSGGSK